MAAAVLSVATLSGQTTLASTVNVTAQHSSVFGDTDGENQWKILARYRGNPDLDKQWYSASAGAFRLNVKDMAGKVRPIVAFCLSPFETLRLSLDYMVGTEKSLLTPTMLTRLSALANGAWSEIADATTAGAFQLAAWEIVGEADAWTGLDLSIGSFHISTKNDKKYSVPAAELAQTWLNKVSDNTFRSTPKGISIFSADRT